MVQNYSAAHSTDVWQAHLSELHSHQKQIQLQVTTATCALCQRIPALQVSDTRKSHLSHTNSGYHSTSEPTTCRLPQVQKVPSLFNLYTLFNGTYHIYCYITDPPLTIDIHYTVAHIVQAVNIYDNVARFVFLWERQQAPSIVLQQSLEGRESGVPRHAFDNQHRSSFKTR